MLKATDISKTYITKRGEVTALAPCSIEFGECGLVLVCGESGCGKTTILNILACTDTPSSGEVECSYGKNYASFVFQGGRLSDSLTVEENFELVSRMFPEKCSDFRAQAEQFGLAGLLKRKPSELSFGEVQRAAILRAAMVNRPVLFADEPTANLDEENCRMVAGLLKEISRERLVIVSTHERGYFEDIADRIIVLKRGAVVSDTQKDEYKRGAQAAEQQSNAAPPVVKADGAALSGSINNSAPRFAAKTAFWLAGKTLRRTAVAVALTMVFLVVCLFSLATCSNIFFSDDIRASCSAVRADGSLSLDLKKDFVDYGNYYLNSTVNGGDTSPITDGQIEEFGEKYGAVPFVDISGGMLSVPADSLSGDITVRRVYVSDTCFFPVLYGSADLSGGIAISSVSAEAHKDGFGVENIADMIGMQAGGFTISCIYSAASEAYEANMLSGLESRGDFENRVIMPESAFLQFISAEYGQLCTTRLRTPGVNGGYGELRLGAYSLVKDNSMYFAPVYGENGPQAGEMYVSERYASQNGGTDAVLGTQITYTFIAPDGSFVPYTFTVTGVFDTMYMNYCVLSDGDALDLIMKFGEWRMNGRSGICLPEYSESDVRELKEAGFSESSYLTENISEALGWFDSIADILFIVCAVSAVCALAALAFYAAYSFAKCGREVGILRSFGLSAVRASAVFFCQLCMAVAASLVAGAVVSVAAIPAWNAAAFSVAGAMTVYFVPVCLAVAVGAAALAFGFGALFVYLSAVKKSAARFLREG